jgi:hypothetical protein
MQQFLIDIQPALTTLVEAIITALIAWGVVIFKQKTGIDIEDKYKRDLHDAAMTGARVVIAKWGAQVDIKQTEGPVEHVVAHIHNSVPDAVRELDPSAGVLGQLAVAKLEVAKNEAAKEKSP